MARAQDAGGTAVEGITISFTPDTDNGSVSVGSGDSDANGEVSTEWTLGPGFGEQTLFADITGAQAQVMAIARSENPIADLVLNGAITVNRGDPSSLETFTVGATVENEGDLSTQTTFTVRLLENGSEIGSTTAGPLAPSATELVVFSDVGPVTAGSKTLTVEVDSNDEITELIESNNDGTRNITVARMIYRLRRQGILASEEGGNPLTESLAVQAIISLLRIGDHPGIDIVRNGYRLAAPVAVGIELGVGAIPLTKDGKELEKKHPQFGVGGV